MLLGLLRTDAGSVRLLGGDPWAQAADLHRRLAYVPGELALWPNLTGGQVIDLLGRLRGGIDERRRAELIDRFELDPTKKGRTYSKGNRQKVALVAALASDVELLLLDEPTTGLDPLMEAVFRSCVDEFRDSGRTVLLSSHILAEVEELCDRVSIIRAGRRVETGSLADLRHLTRTTVRSETVRPAHGPDRDDRRARPRHRRQPRRLRGRHRRARHRPRGAARGDHPHAERHAAHARGAVPAPLRRHAPRPARGRAVTGTWTLVRHFLRRDRWMLLWWSLGITLLYWSQAVSVEAVYATQADLDRAAALMGSNAAFVAMAGPARALNTVGGQVTWQATAFGAVAVGPHVDVPRRAAHPGRGGERPRRAAARLGRSDAEATTAATVVVVVLANLLVGRSSR